MVVGWLLQLKIVRAVYGAAQNAHALLHCDDPSIDLPHELLALSDRPPGYTSPGEKWWPSIGCAPLGEWWAIWYTIPDTKTERSGMVRSDTALFRLADIGFVDDLVPIIMQLSGNTDLPSASVSQLLQTAEAILKDENPIVVWKDENTVPFIIASLWKHFWPDARKSFSCRAAFTPPQDTTSASSPLLYCIPAFCSMQWGPPFKLIDLTSAPISSSRFGRSAKYLSGCSDETMRKAIESLPPRNSDLKYLNSIARIADNIDCLNSKLDFDCATSLLRTITAAFPDENGAARYIEQALSSLCRTINEANLNQIMSLGNISLENAPGIEMLKTELQKWILNNASNLNTVDSLAVLHRLLPTKSLAWWQSPAVDAVRKGIDSKDRSWMRTALEWLSAGHSDDILMNLIPARSDLETELLVCAENEHFTDDGLEQLQHQAEKRCWSRLYAWCSSRKLSAVDAFDFQFSFHGDPLPGINLLLRKYPVNEVMQVAVNRNDDKLCEPVASLTVENPALLIQLDISQKNNRLIWAAHIRNGGVPWIEGFHADTQGKTLIETVLEGGETYNLLALTATELADAILDFPERKKLWEKLNPDESQVLLPIVAAKLTERMIAGLTVAEPEETILNEIVKRLHNSQQPALVILNTISWKSDLSEHVVSDWLSRFTKTDWKSFATPVGKIVKDRGWKKCADSIYSWTHRIPEAIPAVEEFSSLLSVWNRCLFSFSRSPNPKNHKGDKMPLINRVAELGSDLLPNGLEGIWERTGRKLKHLKFDSRPIDQWQNAAQHAFNDDGLKGLLSLVNELLKEFPNNDDLHEIKEVLNKVSH